MNPASSGAGPPPPFPPAFQPSGGQSHRGGGGRNNAAVPIRNASADASAGSLDNKQSSPGGRREGRDAKEGSHHSPSRRGNGRRGARDNHRNGHRYQQGQGQPEGEGGRWRGEQGHNSSSSAANGSSSSSSVSGSTKSLATPALSARNANAAVFIPKAASASGKEQESSGQAGLTNAAGSLSLSHAVKAAVFNPSSKSTAAAVLSQEESGAQTPNSYDAEVDIFDPTYAGPLPADADNAGMSNGYEEHDPSQMYNPYEQTGEYLDPSGAGTMDMYSQQQAAAAARAAKIRQPLQYHQYAPPLPHVSNLHPHHLASHAFFLHPSQREELQRKQEAIFVNIPPPELGGPSLPEELHVYHSLVPLEPIQAHAAGQPSYMLNPSLLNPTLDESAIGTNASGGVGIMGASGDPSKLFGYRSHSYKAVCSLDGKSYVLRRLEGFKLQHEVAIGLVERWRRIRHPSIVSVREAFTTRAFGDSSIVFVYDYHPIASTLHAEHMVPKPPQPDRRTGRLQVVSMQVTEKTLWSYVCQLANALRCIHKAGLAARGIEPSKVLKTGENRVRINCCSIFDVIAYDPHANPSAMQNHQADDLLNLGKLMLCVACNNTSASSNMPRSLEQITRVYSPELKSMIMWLLQKPHQKKDADELVRLLAGRMADEFDSALNYNDSLESSLMRELENARLVRLLCKFGFINERPEFDHDPRWSETGDRYVVKLFRDFLFHSVNEQGRPLVDLSHILVNLNKLDAGSEERIMLTSRDDQSCIVASYREIKNCIESAFQDLSRVR